MVVLVRSFFFLPRLLLREDSPSNVFVIGVDIICQESDSYVCAVIIAIDKKNETVDVTMLFVEHRNIDIRY